MIRNNVDPQFKSYLYAILRISKQGGPIIISGTVCWNVFNYISFLFNLHGNLQAVHFDRRLFPEPEKFKPERFVKDNKLTNTENVMPFSIGKLIYMYVL